MRLLSINSAEAIFEPFFDSETNDLAAWTIGAPGAEGINHRQGWAFAGLGSSRAFARIRIPAGVEAILEDLPLQAPGRTAVEAARRDIAQFGLAPAETQPRLTFRQRGRRGILRVEVQLVLKNRAALSPVTPS